jgi:Cytochrome c7 and related cytochrome c
MAALFPRHSNTVLGVLVLAGVTCTTVVLSAPMLFVRTQYGTQQGDPVVQPVDFDHRHHTRDDGIDCEYCHFQADRSRYAGVPPTELCMGCHAQVWNDSPLLAVVRQSYFDKTPIRWARVHQLPDFVRFDHSVHVNKGVGCESCHGRVDLMAAVYQVEPLTMEFCLDCHRDPVPHLRPREHVTDMDYRPVPTQAVVGAEIQRSLHVSPRTDCSTCHF